MANRPETAPGPGTRSDARRALDTLRSANRAVLRANDEIDLLQDICRIAVEIGGFDFAWVGQALGDQVRTIRPVAWAGAAGSYLSQPFRWSDTALGRGPAGTAIREGRPVIMRDMTDDAFRPWLEAARDHGFASMMSVPLMEGGQSWGMMALYSGKMNAFDGEESDLLLDMAEDVAFGIERLRMRDELESCSAANNLLQRVIDHVPDIVFCKDDEFRFVYVNEACSEFLGCRPEEALGLSDFDLFDRELAEFFRARDCEALAAGQAVRNQQWNVYGDGRRRLLEMLKAPVDLGGGRTGVIGIGRDISDVHSEQAERARLTEIVEATPDFVGVGRVEPDGSLTSVYRNAAWEKLGHAAGTKLQELPVTDFHPAEINERSRTNIVPEVLRQGTMEWESVIMTVDGTEIPVSQLFIDHGQAAPDQPRFISTIMRDISGYKKAQAELTEAKDLAEAASRAKSMFLNNMSHELRTPLNAVIGFGEIISTRMLGGEMDAIYQNYASDIVDSARHLLALVNDILDISRIESQAYHLEPEAIELRPLVQSVFEWLQGMASDADVALEMPELPDTPDAGRTVVCDPRAMRQILINLVGNAIKFNRAGGSVTVEVVTGEDETEIRVSDTGIGIAPDCLKRVFDPFVQVARETNNYHQGTGLGLPLCRRLIETHGGGCEVTSTVGEGSVFTVRLPRVLPTERSDLGEASAVSS